MNSIERVRGCIRGEDLDHLAAQPMLMMFAAQHAGMRYIDYTRDGAKMAEAQLRAAGDFGLDCLLTCSDPAKWPTLPARAAWIGSSTRDRSSMRPGRPCSTRTASRPSACPIPWPPGGCATASRPLRSCGEPLALAQELRGLGNIMMDFIDDPDFVRRLLDFTAEVAIGYAPAQIEAGADTIGMSDAAASMIGPALYSEFLWPAQRRVLQSIRDRYPCVTLRLHMCGRTDPLIVKMRDLPIDIYELDFPVDLPHARADLGTGKVISGNVSTLAELLKGTPEDVYEACRRCHEAAGRYHIVGAGCEVSPLTPPEDLRAMVAYARQNKP